MSSYTNTTFKSVLEKYKINIILEIGSMHGLDTIDLIKHYKPEKIVVVECNPDGINLCKKNLSNYKEVILIETAAWNIDTELSFYKVVESYDPTGTPSHKTDMYDCNIGASSCFKSNGNWPYERYVQKEIKVKAKRLDKVLLEKNIVQVDLICMDVQGAALQALEGLGDYLKNTKAIITELETEPIYHQQSLYKDVVEHLKQYNFFPAYKYQWSELSNDYLFLQK
jgi:FkbM family methyltransferase